LTSETWHASPRIRIPRRFEFDFDFHSEFSRPLHISF
jgi:hypothetical protein